MTSTGLLITFLPGHSSGHDVQVSRQLRFYHTPLPPHHQEDLDKPAIVGGLHPLRKADRPRELRRPSAATKGPAPRARRQAAESEGGLARVRRQEGGEQGADGGVP